MKEKNTKSSSQGIRLSHETWPDLRYLIQQGYRVKLEKWIALQCLKLKEKTK